jgi:hypothetical protein
MKLCHAATLALIGWYLMCPPVQNSCWIGEETWNGLVSNSGPSACQNEEHPNYDAPLNQWEDFEQFDSVTECKDDIGRNSSLKTGTCKCIATDDPRLKGIK